jgi:DNA polymerase III delta prime subunit
MSEETAVEQEVSDPVDTLPDQQMDFSSALDKAFEALNQPEPEPEPETEPESKSEETPEIQSEDKSEPEVEVEEKQEELESFDPTDNLDAEIGDDWTPKAASRFKQLKSELKSATDELEALRQKASESDVKVKELSGEINASDIEEMQKKLAEYEQEKMFTNLEGINKIIRVSN